MVNKLLKFNVYGFMLFLLLWVVVVAVFVDTAPVVYADTPIVALKEVNAEIFDGVKDNKAQYSSGKYDGNGYSRNCVAVFGVTSNYYRFYFSLNGGEMQPYAGGIQNVPANGEVSFYTSDSGIYNIICKAYSSLNEDSYLAEAAVTVKNDITSPMIFDIESMDEWRKTGSYYYTDIDWSKCEDDLSGIYKIYYYYTYKNGDVSETFILNPSSLTNIVTIGIDRYCVMTILCYDNAGNVTIKEFLFDKFDDIAPMAPTYTITPECKTGSYSNEYVIEVDYHDDLDTIATCGYIINGETNVYEQPIILNKAMKYDIKLYAVDTAGNVSDYTQIVVPYSAFDTNAPIISGEQYLIDITADNGICTISFVGSDANESGIKEAYLVSSNIAFNKTSFPTHDLYVASFDCFDLISDVLRVVDNAGNIYEKQYNFNYFNDKSISDAVKICRDGYNSLVKSNCTDDYWDKIVYAYEKLNMLLSVNNSSKSDILNAIEQLEILYDVDINVLYTIKTIPKNLSGILTFDAISEDFPNSKKGTVLSVSISETDADNKDYRNISGFKKCFTNFFRLDLFYNGEAITENLTNGIKVSMNMPINYYERDYKLYNLETGEELKLEIENNKLIFNIKSSSGYVLVISGSQAEASIAEAEKTINVFGNILKYSTFLWVVCGSAGVAILLILGLIVVKIVRK